MKTALAVTIPLLALLACSAAPGVSAKAEPAGVDKQITARVTDGIWPAVNAYNGAPTQTSAGSAALIAVIDPTLQGDAFGALRSAAAKLGRQGDFDPATRLSYGNDGMTAARTDVTAAGEATATVNVCYTYTQWSYVNFADRTSSPAAGQVNMDLVNVNNVWFLHAITGDHAVPGCPANND
jgi:hypothetical protein